jgi:hypothetical protein
MPHILPYPEIRPINPSKLPSHYRGKIHLLDYFKRLRQTLNVVLGHGVPPDYDVEIYDGRTPFLLMTQDMIHHLFLINP